MAEQKQRYGPEHEGSIGISRKFRSSPLTVGASDKSNKPVMKLPVLEVKGLDDEESHYDADNIQNKNINPLVATSTSDVPWSKNQLMMAGEPIVLNIGGTKYQTTLITLCRYPSSVLCKMFEGRFSLKPDKNGSYFIDRNGKYFDIILDYMRTGKLIIPDQNQQYLLNHLLSESEFYQIMPLIADVCAMKISLESRILSVKHIKQIQEWMNDKANPLMDYKWKLLYQYNRNKYKRDVRDAYGFDQPYVVKLIEHRESVLLIFTKFHYSLGFTMDPSVIGIFIKDKINVLKSYDNCCLKPNGFCFKMSQTSAEKYKIQMLEFNSTSSHPYFQCGTNSVERKSFIRISASEVGDFEIFGI